MGIISFFKNTFGTKGDQSTVAEIENGKPRLNQVYKGLRADGTVATYLYVCKCGGENGIPSGRLDYLKTYPCANCGKNFCIADWLKQDMADHRPLLQGGKTNDAPFTSQEDKAAEDRLPYRWLVNPQSQQRARIEDIHRQLNGGSGEVHYDGPMPGVLDMNSVAFSDPSSGAWHRTAASTGEHRTTQEPKRDKDYERRVEDWNRRYR